MPLGAAAAEKPSCWNDEKNLVDDGAAGGGDEGAATALFDEEKEAADGDGAPLRVADAAFVAFFLRCSSSCARLARQTSASVAAAFFAQRSITRFWAERKRRLK